MTPILTLLDLTQTLLHGSDHTPPLGGNAHIIRGLERICKGRSSDQPLGATISGVYNSINRMHAVLCGVEEKLCSVDPTFPRNSTPVSNHVYGKIQSLEKQLSIRSAYCMTSTLKERVDQIILIVNCTYNIGLEPMFCNWDRDDVCPVGN